MPDETKPNEGMVLFNVRLSRVFHEMLKAKAAQAKQTASKYVRELVIRELLK